MVGKRSRQDTGQKGQDRTPWTLRKLGGKPVWDYLDLLSKFLVPVAVAVFGWIIATAQYAGQQEAEIQRAQQSTLQAYFDGVQVLLLDRNLRHNPDEKFDERNLARARTITALDALDPTRKSRLLRFLYETELIQARTQNRVYHPDELEESQQPTISLRYANLTGEGVPTAKGNRVCAIRTLRKLLASDEYRPHSFEELEWLVTPEVAARLSPEEEYGIQWYNRQKVVVRTVAEPDGSGGRRYRKSRKFIWRPREEWLAIPVPAYLPRTLVDKAHAELGTINPTRESTQRGRGN